MTTWTNREQTRSLCRPLASHARTLVSRSLISLALALFLAAGQAPAQQATGAQQLAFAGLRSMASRGQFNAVQVDSAGEIYLLLDQKDGVRLLKTDAGASTVLAQAQLGSAGDIGVAMALDPAGNVLVTGTTTSGTLAGTPGSAFPAPTDTSTNSFLARFDPNLNLVWVSFAGSGRLAATSVVATSDAVFLAGSLFAATLPVTPAGIQQAPAQGSFQNGFVERFSIDGTTLVYATYLTGANGDTAPSAIQADAADETYIAGYTTAPGFPTVAALVPRIAPVPVGSFPASGFLTKLTPAGDGITFSTFIPGAAITSLALDPVAGNLILSGTIDLGRFPVANATMPLVATAYQTLLRIAVDGSAVVDGTVLAPGTSSFAAPARDGSTWIAGSLSVPLLPLLPLAGSGQAFAFRVTPAGGIDQAARFGGLPTQNPNNAAAPVQLTSLAISPAGQPVLGGAFQPTASSSLLATERYDLPLTNAPTGALPSEVADAALATGSCNGSLCAGSGAFLAALNPNVDAPALAFSTGASPDIILRNLGSTQATGLQLSANGFSLATTCTDTLAAGAECFIALNGPGPGSLTAQAGNAIPQTAALPAAIISPSSIVFFPRELDFGVQTSTSSPILRTLTVTNLSQQPQTFVSALDTMSRGAAPFSETTSDCPLSADGTTRLLAAAATCHITFAFALTSATLDGPVQAFWTVAATGTSDVLLTGFAQSAALAVSAPEIAFGTQFAGGLRSPRFLYLSNNSDSAIPHAPTALGPPFTAIDRCPSTLLPHSVCQMELNYASSQTPTDDSSTLTLDQGLSVLVSGQTLPQPNAGNSVANPNLSVTPPDITFANAVAVTGVSATTQTVTVANTGTIPFTLSLTLTGDFTDTTSCGAILAANQTCAVVLAFAPTVPGTRTGLIAVTAGTGTSPAYVTLAGTATEILPSKDGVIDFGSVLVTEPAVQWFKVLQPFRSFTASTTGAFKVLFVEDIGFGHGSPPPQAFQSGDSGTCLNCFIGIQFQPGSVGVLSAPSRSPRRARTRSSLPLLEPAFPSPVFCSTPLLFLLRPFPFTAQASPCSLP